MSSAYQCFTVREQNDRTIVDLHNPASLPGLLDHELKKELVDLIEQRRPERLLVNFEKVHHCPTAVINGLISANRRLNYGGRMVLVGMEPRIRRVFQVLRLEDRVFEISDDVLEA